MNLARLPITIPLCVALCSWLQDPVIHRDWSVVQPDGARAKVLMPVGPQAHDQTFEPEPGKPLTLKLQIAKVDEKFVYIFGYHDQEPAASPQAEREILEWAIKNQIARSFGVIEKGESIRAARLPGRQIQYTYTKGDQKLRVASRLLLDGGRLYQLTYIAPQDEFQPDDARKFLESFERVSDAPLEKGPEKKN